MGLGALVSIGRVAQLLGNGVDVAVTLGRPLYAIGPVEACVEPLGAVGC